MGHANLKILSTLPNAASLRAIVDAFAKSGGPGAITAFEESRLYALSRLADNHPNLEVLAFPSLVSKMSILCGEPPRSQAQGSQYESAVSHACQSLPQDSPFAKTAAYPGLHKALARTLRELRSHGIDEEELSALAAKASGRLKAKLESLASIGDAARSTLANLGRQLTDTSITTCFDLSPKDSMKAERVLVVAGAGEQPRFLEWVRWAAENGCQVTLVVEKSPHEGKLFAATERFASFFSAEVESPTVATGFLGNVFAPQRNAKYGSDEPEIAIVSAADPLAESEWAIRHCLGRINEGVPPGQLAIFARDLQTYAPLIETAARRLGVPVRAIRRVPLLTNGFARLLLQLLEFCASEDVRTLAPCVHSTYLGLNASQRNALIAQLRVAYRSGSSQWQQLAEWAAEQEYGFYWLLKLLEWRHECVQHPVSLAGWNEKLRLLGQELPMFTEEGMAAQRQRDIRAQTSLQRALAQEASIQRVLDERVLTLQQFVKVCERLWEETDTSIPPNDTGVHVTDTAGALPEIESLYVVGMLEGIFPRRRSEDPILTDAERAEISKLRPEQPRLLNSFDKAAGERDEFYRLCAAPNRSLMLSYPQTDESRDNVPAFYLSEIEMAAQQVVHRNLPRSMLTPEHEDCQAKADIALREALEAEKEYALANELTSPEVHDALRPDDEQQYTPQELRDAFQCPFRFFARHVLDVAPNRLHKKWNRLRRLPQAAGLLTASNQTEAREKLLAQLDAEIDSMVGEVPEWELNLLRSGGRRLIEEWIHREFVARKLWQKDPGSVQRDVAFGEGPLISKFGKITTLKGRVPGTAKLGNYNVVQLFERGVPPRDGNDFAEESDKLFYGLHLLAEYKPGHGAALEIESMSGQRTLYVLPRKPGTPLPGKVQDGLNVVYLDSSDDPAISIRAFYDDITEKLKRTMKRIEELRVDPQNGEHCTWCDYGELCRRSLEFPDEESPFGIDISRSRENWVEAVDE